MHRRALALVALFVLVALAGTPLLAADHNVTVGPGNNFSPKFLTINAGDRVIWTLAGGFHNVQADDDSFTSGPIGNSWGPFERTFPSAGVVGYHCDAHGSPGGGMFGTITVQGGGGGDAGALSFTGNQNRTVGEGAGNITLTLSRTGGDDGAVSVDFETVNNGTADTPADYIQTNQTISWPDNNDNNMQINVPIVDDGDIEGSETFSVHIVNPQGGATLGGLTTVNITITDNDEDTGSPGTIRFQDGSYSANEGDANASLVVRRVNGSNGAVSVAYSTANGTATAGSDFQGATNQIVSWGDGDSANKTIQIPIVGDTVEEPSESFSVNLSLPTGGATLGTPSSATVTITDDDITCEPCVADATTLCLAGGSGTPNRFRVKVDWRDFEGNTGHGMAVPSTPDSGFFYFFDPSNIELIAKMVNGCGTAFDAFWFFYAAASNVELDYQILDTVACTPPKTYHNELGTFASDGDVNALPCAAAAASQPSAAVQPSVLPAFAEPVAATPANRRLSPRNPDGTCPACDAGTALCLAGGSGTPGRFEVSVTWTDFEQNTGQGIPVPSTPDSGFFYFFDPSNIELLAKMVNGCGSQFDAYWFFYAAASNVGLHYVVRDTLACEEVTYDNPLGTFASDGDVNALATCAAAASPAPSAGGTQ